MRERLFSLPWCLAAAAVLLGACTRSDAESPTSANVAVRALQSSPLPTVSAPAAPVSEAVPEEPAPVEAPPTEARRIVLAAGGDVNFGRECGQEILKDPSYDPFSGLGEAWNSADLRFVNLESQLSEQGGETQSPRHRLIFTGPPGGADVLSRASVSLVSTANNHAWDYGKSALLETIQNLERARVGFAGTGRDLAETYRPVVLRVGGASVALFAVTQVWNQPPFGSHPARELVAWADIQTLKPAIVAARREHDFVLVSFHGGEEYVHAPTERVKSFIAMLMALGVDAVLGHHPHVPQGIGFYEGRPILYSLGDLVFAGHQDRPWTLQSFFARLTLRKGEPPVLAACPFALDGHRPRSFDVKRERVALELFRRHLLWASLYTGGIETGPLDERGCFNVTPKSAQASASSSN